MKLLIIFTSKFTELSGISNNVMKYYKNLDKRDMQIDFVTINQPPKKFEKIINDNNGTVYTFDCRNRRVIIYMRKLYELLRKKNYDIVHAHGNSTTLAIEMLASKLAGIKIRIPHSRNTKTQHPIINVLLRPLFNQTYTHPFACGQLAGEWLYKNKPFEIIRNGNEINTYKYNENVRDEYRTLLNLHTKKVLGHVGIFNKQKNHKFLIEIFEKLVKSDDNWVLLLIGDGPLKNETEELCKNYGIIKNVKFIGKTSQVENYMQAMDVFILPSLYEGVPNVLIEAQIASLPSIVSNQISKEAKITNIVNYVDLNKSADIWIQEIESMLKYNRSDIASYVVDEIISEGYSIEENAKHLKMLYNNFLEKECDKNE